MSSSTRQVYLGGGRSEEWRREFEKRFEKHLTAFDPFRDSRQGAAYEFTNDDLKAVSESEFIIASVDYHRYTGLAIEVGYARALEIPVMLIWTIGGRVDTMMAACSSWTFIDYESAFDFIEKRLL